jgi:hypothetical protein
MLFLSIIKLTQLPFYILATIGNSADDCHPKEFNGLQKAGLQTYAKFSWVFFLGIISSCCVLYFVSNAYGKYKDSVLSNPSGPQPSDNIIDRDARYAMETIGEDSVYRFFLRDSLWGWGIAFAVKVAQIGILFIFVLASENELSDGNSDLVYTWKCPRDKVRRKLAKSIYWLTIDIILMFEIGNFVSTR